VPTIANVENLTYGVLVGKYTRIVGDANLDGQEDTEPLAGTITITCDAPQVVVYTPDDASAGGYTDVTPAPVTVVLDSQGYITFDGGNGVTILATDQAYTNPTGFTYTATFALTTFDGLTPLPRKPQSFQIAGGTRVSLPGLTPVSASAGTITVQGPAGTPGTGLNVSGAVDTFVDLPAASGVANQVYTTQDTGSAYLSKSGSWVLLGTIRGPIGGTGLTPTITALVEQLSPGQNPTVEVTGSPENPVIMFGIPAGQPGANTGVYIDDTTTSLSSTWSSQNIDQQIDAGTSTAITFTTQALQQAGLTAAQGQIVYRMQNADGTWPPRGSVATGGIVIWLGTAFPPAAGGFAVAGTDGFMYWDPNA
jgi:hypothetical protein